MEELDSVLEIRQARLLPSSFLQSVIACLFFQKGLQSRYYIARDDSAPGSVISDPS